MDARNIVPLCRGEVCCLPHQVAISEEDGRHASTVVISKSRYCPTSRPWCSATQAPVPTASERCERVAQCGNLLARRALGCRSILAEAIGGGAAVAGRPAWAFDIRWMPCRRGCAVRPRPLPTLGCDSRTPRKSCCCCARPKMGRLGIPTYVVCYRMVKALGRTTTSTGPNRENDVRQDRRRCRYLRSLSRPMSGDPAQAQAVEDRRCGEANCAGLRRLHGSDGRAALAAF